MLSLQEQLKNTIREIPNFPKPGINFKDISTIFLDSDLTKKLVKEIASIAAKTKPDKIAVIESRGFILGASIALELGIPFVLIRKKGKLPAETISQKYQLEYGWDELEVHRDAIATSEKVFVHDDVLATGGTAQATALLIQKVGATVSGFGFIGEITALNGLEKIKTIAPVKSIISY